MNFVRVVLKKKNFMLFIEKRVKKLSENTIDSINNIKINFNVNEFDNRFEVQLNLNNFEKQLKQFNNNNNNCTNIINVFIELNNFYV